MAMKRIILWLAGLLSALTLAFVQFACTPAPQPADLVLQHGKIVTVDDQLGEAQALAVRGDRIVAVGSDAEVQRYIGDKTQVIDLEGLLAIPGFIEGHGHFMGLGQSLTRLDLRQTRNWNDIVSMVAAKVEEVGPGEWIVGRGWHQEKWDETPSPNYEGLPTHEALSKVSPNNPVLLSHASGHATFANAKAMSMAGINRDTKAPAGGEIVRDQAGRPIGVFRETASGLFGQARSQSQTEQTAEQKEAEARRHLELASQECLSKGITSFQDAGSSFATIDFFKKMASEGSLPLRLWVMVRASNESMAKNLADYRLVDPQGFLTVRAIKRGIDGALGAHGAWLLEPYSDLPRSAGLNTNTIEDITETARLAIDNGYQLCVHAIGDRANRETIDIYEKTFEQHADKTDLRWRVEHAQHLHPDDIPRFAELGVIASMQGIHCTSDGPWVQLRLGEQRAREGAYVWQTLMRSGAIVTNGTDAPVEDVSALASYYATVTRRMNNGEIFYGDQRLSREDALRTYTINAARAAFEEDVKGSLTVGKLADITVLSKDIMTIAAEEILDTDVLYTIVGGEVKYEKGEI